MSHILIFSLVGLISAVVGTGIGGLVAILIQRKDNRFLSSLLEFSAGLMLAVICFELLPEAFNYSGAIPTIIGAVCGILLIIVIDDFIKRKDIVNVGTIGSRGLLRTGILVGIGVALHNFPEGFAIGSGYEASLRLGLTLTFVITLHDIPEGIAMAVPMSAGGMSKWKAFLFTLATGIPGGAGAFLGAVFGRISPLFISICLGFAGGAMLYIVVGELIPQSKSLYRGRMPSVVNAIGFLCGLIISWI